mmetsp:Transcript_15333/g.38645  ORF Transcript_15333/g.38645 Transcript_15333/m.38645 type:complete len:116 (+) Transcript_15333:413-760(+)
MTSLTTLWWDSGSLRASTRFFQQPHMYLACCQPRVKKKKKSLDGSVLHASSTCFLTMFAKTPSVPNQTSKKFSERLLSVSLIQLLRNIPTQANSTTGMLRPGEQKKKENPEFFHK